MGHNFFSEQVEMVGGVKAKQVEKKKDQARWWVGYVHRWVRGSLAQWLEPSIHKQLLISTSRVQIKKKERKRKRRKKYGKNETKLKKKIRTQTQEKERRTKWLGPTIQKQVLISRPRKKEMEKKGKK